jgi:hypothetical protein
MKSTQAMQPPAPLSAFVWLYFVMACLICFAIAQVMIGAALIGLVIAACVFVTPLVGDRTGLQDRLIVAAVSVGVLITAFYPPIIGFFMGIEGRAKVFLVTILLGIRSSLFALWIVAAFLIFVVRGGRLSEYLMFVLFCLVIGVGLVNGGGGFQPKVTYLLNSFLPLFGVLAVITYVTKDSDAFVKYDRLLMNVVLAIAAIGALYFPVLILNTDIFRPDLAMLHQAVAGVSGALPGQWHSRIYDTLVPRFVGTFPNPILFGYFFAVASYVLFVRRRYWFSALFFLGTLLSVSKGAIMFLAVAHVLRFALLKRPIYFWLLLFPIVAFELGLAYLLDGSNRVHLRGLLGGIQSILSAGILAKGIGFGLGSGGNLARTELEGGPYSGGWLASGSESGIGVLVYQLGSIGVLLFLVLAWRALFAYKGLNGIHRTNACAVVALCAAWFSNMLLQEDLINVTIASQMLLAVILLVATRDPRNEGATEVVAELRPHGKSRASPSHRAVGVQG